MKNIKYFVFTLLVWVGTMHCIHEQLLENYTRLVYTPKEQGRRLLQRETLEPIRIFSLNPAELPNNEVKALIENIVGIAKTFFENMLKVIPIEGIIYPESQGKTCNGIIVPKSIIEAPSKPLIQADYGFLYFLVNEGGERGQYVASALNCVSYNGSASNSMRPMWGGIKFNLRQIAQYFKDSVTPSEFQTLAYVAIHELTHALAFSSSLYADYANSSLSYDQQADPFTLAGQPLLSIIKQFYNCTDDTIKGFALQNKNGGASHWEKYYVGNQLMITTTSVQPYVSEATVRLFESTGWYPQVSRDFIEPSLWGKNKGCDFLKMNSCQFQQFQFKTFSKGSAQRDCNMEHIGHGKILKDQKMNNCNQIKLDANTICTSQKYLEGMRVENVNLKFDIAGEKSGRHSKCFRGDLRIKNSPNIVYRNRCYEAACLKNGKYMAIKILNTLQICYYGGFKIGNIRNFDGVIECPANFDQVCKAKAICTFDCGPTGVCINGKCLCGGRKGLHQEPCQAKSRLLFEQSQQSSEKKMLRVEQTLKCTQGHIFDPINRKCQLCRQLLSCSDCNSYGCISCDDGSSPINGKCD